jgi:hypothetical protein
MRTILVGLVLLASAAAGSARELVYEGTWVTTNRPLDGAVRCVVTDLGDNQWRGHFSGVWQAQQFSYEVEFSGPPEKLEGWARIDGADYVWTGEMSQGSAGWFKGTFTGNRYEGSFSMRQKRK